MTTSRRFGAYAVTRLVDGIYKAPTDHLVHLKDPARADAARRDWGAPTFDVPVNCFALSGPDGLTLIDAGAGAAWGPAYGRARDALAKQGVAPADVRRVLLTHFHGDHALGLLDGDAPFFPHAEIWAPAPERAFFTDPRARDTTPEGRRGAFDVAAKVLAAYGARVRSIAAEGAPLAGVETLALPGHTPGHVGYAIGEGEGALLIFGDALHVAALQAGDPDFGFVYDIDPTEAARSRRAALEQAAAQGWIVSGGHIDGFARVARDGAAWRLDSL